LQVPLEKLKHNELNSFSESNKFLKNSQLKEKFNRIHAKQLARVFPKGSRISSSNYDPINFLNSGFQINALNYQTPDKPMQVNRALFTDNGMYD
jgi:hypothetical protein